ncbi:MAG: hypothetical protein AB7P40_09850 [Chloroflexota bacterium]
MSSGAPVVFSVSQEVAQPVLDIPLLPTATTVRSSASAGSPANRDVLPVSILDLGVIWLGALLIVVVLIVIIRARRRK